jgi:ADP-ribose pyrophosphatase YjhB (NUDIX family)
MTPAPSAGSEGTKKKRRRRRPANRSPQNQDTSTPNTAPKKKAPAKQPYAKRVDEVSAGGLVVDSTGKLGLLIGRRDLKDATGKRILWSLPKGHIEEGETPEEAALREVQEETGIVSVIEKSLGVIDFWFMESEFTKPFITISLERAVAYLPRKRVKLMKLPGSRLQRLLIALHIPMRRS